jgi:transposase InsO family protein
MAATLGTVRPEGSTPVKFGAITDSSIRVGAFAPLAPITGCVRSFITPYTSEQNGLVERFFRSLKEECERNALRRCRCSDRRYLSTGAPWPFTEYIIE